MYFSRAYRKRQRLGAVDRNLVFALAALGIVIVGVAFWRLRYKPEPLQIDVSKNQIESESSVSQMSKDWVTMGGVARPATDVRSDKAQTPKQPLLKREGAYPKVALDANPQVAQVAEALKSGKNPERYSSLIVPKSFDAEAFAKDPEKYSKEYASIVEPGRVYAPAQPGDSVPVLRVDGDRHHRVTQGESVRLGVIATPFAPVSFTSTGLGQFENLLTAITVVADQNGKAVAPFTATSGTKHNVNILAASPVLAEQIKFTVSVELPAGKVAENTTPKPEIGHSGHSSQSALMSQLYFIDTDDPPIGPIREHRGTPVTCVETSTLPPQLVLTSPDFPSQLRKPPSPIAFSIAFPIGPATPALFRHSSNSPCTRKSTSLSPPSA